MIGPTPVSERTNVSDITFRETWPLSSYSHEHRDKWVASWRSAGWELESLRTYWNGHRYQPVVFEAAFVKEESQSSGLSGGL